MGNVLDFNKIIDINEDSNHVLINLESKLITITDAKDISKISSNMNIGNNTGNYLHTNLTTILEPRQVCVGLNLIYYTYLVLRHL